MSFVAQFSKKVISAKNSDKISKKIENNAKHEKFFRKPTK